MRTLFLLLLAGLAVEIGWRGSSAAQAQRVPRAAVTSDWTDRQVIFTNARTLQQEVQNRADVRYWRQLYRRLGRRLVGPQQLPPFLNRAIQAGASGASVRDWNMSLGTGSNLFSVGHMPAKYVFDVNQAASCTNDFVVTGTGLAGSTTQATIIGVNNLYTNPGGTGSCTGTGPSILFAYNLSGVTLRHGAVISLDGRKIAFVDSGGVFHVLTWQSGTGNGTGVGTPAVPGTGNTATDVRVTMGPGSGTSPFVDYTNDVAYVTTTSGALYRISGVFNGTPTLASGNGWPVTFPITNVSSPVVDQVSRRVYVNAQGTVYYIDLNAATASIASTSWAFASAASSYPVIVDSTNQRIFGYNPSNGSNAVVAQADTALSVASRVVTPVGQAGGSAPVGVDLNNAYYTGNATGARLYAAGNSAGSQAPALYAIGFNASFKMNTAVSNGPLALSTSTSAAASLITGFYNSTLARDFMFVGVTTGCTSTVTGGCIRSINVTSGFPANAAALNSVLLAASGGTYGIIVDNNSSNAEASSVYYVSRSDNRLVKATQIALN